MVGDSRRHLRRRVTRRQSRRSGIGRWALGLSLLAGLTTAGAQSLRLQEPDQIAVERRNQVLELSWSDSEDRLQGSLQPDTLHEGVPLQVLLNVGSFDGPAFEGPVTITLRETGSTHGQVQTVAKGAVNWAATFTPERAGPHQLDVSFRTTRLKALHANLEVTPRPIPRIFLWAMVGLIAAAALGYGIRSILRPSSGSAEKPPGPSGL